MAPLRRFARVRLHINAHIEAISPLHLSLSALITNDLTHISPWCLPTPKHPSLIASNLETQFFQTRNSHIAMGSTLNSNDDPLAETQTRPATNAEIRLLNRGLISSDHLLERQGLGFNRATKMPEYHEHHFLSFCSWRCALEYLKVKTATTWRRMLVGLRLEESLIKKDGESEELTREEYQSLFEAEIRRQGRTSWWSVMTWRKNTPKEDRDRLMEMAARMPTRMRDEEPLMTDRELKDAESLMATWDSAGPQMYTSRYL